MALVVEDGAGRADAESYISAADANAYHAARGNAAWAALASDTVREQKLRNATSYMVQTYRSRWAGYRVSKDQALDWPRYEVPAPDTCGEYLESNVVPIDVRQACAELALRAISAPLSPDLGRRTKREKVDVIEVEYSEFGAQSTTYPTVDGLLSVFLTGTANSAKVLRA